MKEMPSFIDAVFVDTCIFEALNFDFEGINNQTLPELQRLLKELGIKSLTSSIIKNEISSHITNKAKEKELQLEKLFNKNKDVFPLVGIKNVDKVINKINNLDLVSKYLKEMEKHFREYIILPIPKAELIFDNYFNSIPPFSATGKKKHEFPDAFVIQSILDFTYDNYYKVLVVSSDTDWITALKKESPDIVVEDSITGAIRYLQEKYCDQNLAKMYVDLSGEVWTALPKVLKLFNYYIDDTLSEILNIQEIELKDPVYDYCILSAKNGNIIFSAIAPVEINAKVKVVDESSSVWDDESKHYIMVDFKIVDILIRKDLYFEATLLINEDKSIKNCGSIVINNINNNKSIEIKLDEAMSME